MFRSPLFCWPQWLLPPLPIIPLLPTRRTTTVCLLVYSSLFIILCRNECGTKTELNQSSAWLRVVSVTDSSLTGGLRCWASGCSHAFRIISATFSPIMMHGAFVLPLMMSGMMDASATRKPLTPYTLHKSYSLKVTPNSYHNRNMAAQSENN